MGSSLRVIERRPTSAPYIGLGHGHLSKVPDRLGAGLADPVLNLRALSNARASADAASGLARRRCQGAPHLAGLEGSTRTWKARARAHRCSPPSGFSGHTTRDVTRSAFRRGQYLAEQPSGRLSVATMASTAQSIPAAATPPNRTRRAAHRRRTPPAGTQRDWCSGARRRTFGWVRRAAWSDNGRVMLSM